MSELARNAEAALNKLQQSVGAGEGEGGGEGTEGGPDGAGIQDSELEAMLQELQQAIKPSSQETVNRVSAEVCT